MTMDRFVSKYAFWTLRIVPYVYSGVYYTLLYTYAVICPNNIVSALCNNSYFGWRRID